MFGVFKNTMASITGFVESYKLVLIIKIIITIRCFFVEIL